MPELPEVETIARALREGGRGGEPVLGRVIERAHLLWQRTLAFPDPAAFFARLPGQRIQAVGRRGKFLILSLSQSSLLIHLRMSGDLRVEPAFDPAGEPLTGPLPLTQMLPLTRLLPRPHLPHDRLALDFTDGLRLAFNDTRKFGRAWLVDDPQQVVGGLGPEPFDPQFTPQALYARLGQTRRQIKPLLLDQAFIAGLGNIYTDEALHQARIHPLRPADSLSADEAERLWQAIRAVLSEGIRRNGASIDWAYRGGDFQNTFAVYQRTGQPCPHCGVLIVRITAGQRGTHFCPQCQPT